MEAEPLVSSPFFLFLFKCGFDIMLMELKNTMSTLKVPPLQRQPESEKNICLWHLPFPFCDPLVLFMGSPCLTAKEEQS